MSATIAVKVNGVWKTPNKPDVTDPVDPVDPIGVYTDDNPPWALQPGESVFDNMPSAGRMVNASTYSTSTDLRVVLQAVADANIDGVYVYLDLHPRYYINSFQEVNPNNWVAFHNSFVSGRRIMGLIGNGPTATSVCVSPGAANATTNLRSYVLAATKAIGDLPVSCMYFSGLGASVPFFMSGISFDGQFQTPYGVYNTTVQAQFNRNQGVSSPLAYSGMSIWRMGAGSRMQFCRFRGFAYALLNAPPFEKGALATNYSDGLVIDRVEVDGRIAGEFDSTRHRTSGGLMQNKDIKATIRNTWLHHTRRSGHAINTNTGLTSEQYLCENFQTHDITGYDEYASGGTTFPSTNVEGVVGMVKHTNMRTNLTAASAHIYLAIPYSGSPGVYKVPDRPIIYVTGFSSDETTYNGCLRISVPKTPNSTGQSPAWDKINALGIAGSNLFDIRRADGTPMVGIKSTSFNGAVHNPSNNFVVIY